MSPLLIQIINSKIKTNKNNPVTNKIYLLNFSF